MDPRSLDELHWIGTRMKNCLRTQKEGRAFEQKIADGSYRVFVIFEHEIWRKKYPNPVIAIQWVKEGSIIKQVEGPVRNSKREKSSPMWFSIGVPVKASRCSPLSCLMERLTCDPEFLIIWASSRMIASKRYCCNAFV